MSLAVVFLLVSSIHAQLSSGPCLMRAEARGCAADEPVLASRPVVTGAVSVKSLRADPSGKAERELEQALWDVKYKNWKGALKHFEKAVRADEAHSRASANWALLELQLGEAEKAESIIRKALAHDPENRRLKHLLGAALVAQDVFSDEAAVSFADAAVESPKALLAAAHVEFRRGNWSSARRFASAYLTSGNAEFRDFAERLKALPDTAR